MPTINLTQNFIKVFDTLQKKNMNITAIAKSMVYTTSAQLHSVTKGESMLSTKAITALILNANVNPTYLYLGTGDMFLTDETELEKLQKENTDLQKKHNEALKTVVELTELIKKLEKRNADLIDLSSAAIKYHKEHKDEESNADGKK
jgi:hypothetical protein